MRVHSQILLHYLENPEWRTFVKLLASAGAHTPHGPHWTSILCSLSFPVCPPSSLILPLFLSFPLSSCSPWRLDKNNCNHTYVPSDPYVCVFVRVHDCLFGLSMSTDLLPGDREIKFTMGPLWRVEQSYVTNPFRSPHSFNLPQEWPLLTCHAKNKNFRTHSSNGTWWKKWLRRWMLGGTFCLRFLCL